MIQNTNFTYNGLLNILNSFAQAHIDVRRFVAEDVDQMSEITSKEELFPMMFVAPINNIYDWQINQYEVRIYVYDRLLKDRSNINDIRSKTNQILNDLDVWLRKESQLPIEVTNISIAYPFSSELMTDVTGWYFDVVIDIPSYETCKIPFLNGPVISGFTCDVVYTNDYLTCQELVDCPIIQDIQNDIINIENILPTKNTRLFSQTGDSVTIVNTDVETSIIDGGVGSLNVPANAIQIGDSFRLVMGGIISNHNNEDIKIKLKSGSVILADSNFQTLTQHTNDVFKLEIDFTIRNIGTTGTASIITLGGFQTIKKNTANITGFGFEFINNTTFDTTISNVLDITVEWNNANNGNSIKSQIFTITKTY